MFDNNFGKCGLIFKIFHQVIHQKILLCTHHKDFHLTCNMLLHHLVKTVNPKVLPNFHVERDN